MSKHFSKDIAKTLKIYFQDSEIPFAFDEEFGRYCLELPLDDRSAARECSISVEEHSFHLCCTLDIQADVYNQKMMSAVEEFICRTNYRLSTENGYFVFDVRGGNVWYQAIVECENMQLSKEAVKKTLDRAIIALNDNAKGFKEIIVNDLNPISADHLCEKLRL